MHVLHNGALVRLYCIRDVPRSGRHVRVSFQSGLGTVGFPCISTTAYSKPSTNIAVRIFSSNLASRWPAQIFLPGFRQSHVRLNLRIERVPAPQPTYAVAAFGDDLLDGSNANGSG